jgi:hypothetical protein
MWIHVKFIVAKSTAWTFFIFWSSKIRITPTSVISSLFPPWWCLSHLADIVTPPLYVTFPSHGANTSSLTLLHLSTTLHPIVPPLEVKSKHWIRTTGHPSQTVWLPPSTAIKRSYQPHHLITSLFYLLPSQSTTTSELHLSLSFIFTTVTRPSSLRTTTSTITNEPTLFHFLNILSICEFM